MDSGIGLVGIPVGTELPLVPFDGGLQRRSIIVSSAVAVGGGASAYVLVGHLHSDGVKGSDVALKVFPSLLSVHNQELLLRELQICRKFRHPLLLPFLGTSSYGLHTILVSQYMSNGNLRDYVIRNPDCNRRQFVLQVAQGLQFLHNSVKYVHGDLKCHNILVSNKGTAILADFGLSTAIDKAASEATTATDIRQRHSLRFAAPEILLDSESYDGDEHNDIHTNVTVPGARMRSKTPASDVYAFGMVVIEIFTGERPWTTTSDMNVIMLVTSGATHPVPSQAFERGFAVQHWELCQRCWSFRPDERPNMRSVVLRLLLLDAVPSWSEIQSSSAMRLNDAGKRPTPSRRTLPPVQPDHPRQSAPRDSSSLSSATRSWGPSRSRSTQPSSISSLSQSAVRTSSRKAVSLPSTQDAAEPAPPLSASRIPRPAEGWDSLYLSVLSKRDSVQLRYLLERSDLDTVMPLSGLCPLTQTVVLTLSFRIAQEVSEMSPLDDFFRAGLEWIKRCVMVIDAKDTFTAPWAACVLSKVLTQLSMTKPSMDILPNHFIEATDVPRLVSEVEALVEEKVQMLGGP
ncbi:kinase-like protein [Exidia glandulosa HHB12029]|uniref:Kinase-like protein n=1 Tax=Exidia glandulosa HHB12029 TaxID=1314781 RepID=A0A165K4S8_EXIGL|nr:kinase-like protein [Exidia glandulosa HHB12029]